MLGVFASLDLFLFYIFWELCSSDVLLIGIWATTGASTRPSSSSFTMAARPHAERDHRGWPSRTPRTGTFSFDLLKAHTTWRCRRRADVVLPPFALAFAIKVRSFPLPHLASRRPLEAPRRNR